MTDIIDDTIGMSVYQEGETPPPPVPSMLFGGILMVSIAIGGIYLLTKKK